MHFTKALGIPDGETPLQPDRNILHIPAGNSHRSGQPSLSYRDIK